MQINFIGPAVDELTVTSNVLRRGKNNVTLRAELDSEAGAGTHGYFTFGVERELDMVMDYPPKENVKRPEDIEPYEPNRCARIFWLILTAAGFLARHFSSNRMTLIC